MACTKSDFLGICSIHDKRTKWTDEDGICFVEDDKENECPDFNYIDMKNMPSVIKYRNRN